MDDLVFMSETMEGTKGEVLETEGVSQEQGAEGEPLHDKSGIELGRR